MAKHKLTPILPGNHLSEIAGHELLDQLSGPEIVIYLRLVARSEANRTVHPKNHELYARNQQIIPRVLRKLEGLGLIRVKYQTGSADKFGRAITVKR